MNIIIFSPSWPKSVDANGIVTYCDNIVSSLKDNGHQVFVLAANKAEEYVQKDCVYIDSYRPTFIDKVLSKVGGFFSAGFEQYYLGASAILYGVRIIEKTAKIDLLEMEESFGWHYFLQKRVSFPIAMRLHGPHYINGTMGGKTLTNRDYQRFKREERAFRAARYVNAPCRWVLDEPQKKFGIKWPVQAVFFNPISALSKSECWSSSSYVKKQILFVGRFDAHKGGDLVIRAFAKVLAYDPGVKLVFVGPDRGVELPNGERFFINDAIKQYIPSSQESCVEFVGLADSEQVKLLRRHSHFTIMASRNENFPYTVIESLASAAPIIAARVGGITEVFKDKVSGMFFEGSNVEDLASKMITLLQDDRLLCELSGNAYYHCQSAFSPDLIARQAIGFYEQAINDYKNKA
ncbi:glycosyl transferase, group 1 [gamma proteobacterium IMCC1989]|nr:glycosyl transferase, group 1 [gamma proteobacterium IMCC1989]